MPEVVDWLQLSERYTETLLLGNGSSMAIDPCFSFRSLRDAAATRGLITPSIQKVFDHLNTQDFELVMSMIWHAYHVNVALAVPDSTTGDAYEEVKAALVGAVRGTHAPFSAANPHLRSVACFMQQFNTVLSLNYDLIVYWAMLEGNVTLGTWFKDCFVNGALHEDWNRLRKPYQAAGATLVFYPHGNLALTTDIVGNESKIARQNSSDPLLDRILAVWNSGGQFPLFVSEGESKQKEIAILRSTYLSTVYQEVLPSLGSTYAIFGWSASDNDAHILKRICKPSTKLISFSVHRGDQPDSRIRLDCKGIELTVHRINPTIEVEFFWADSAGCWTNANCEKD